MDKDTQKFLKEIVEHVDNKAEEIKEETQRHFGVVAEDLRSDFRAVAEQVADNSVKITNIQEILEVHGERFDGIEATLAVMKDDISIIKNDLKQKVDRDEFAALEKRVNLLEAKTNR